MGSMVEKDSERLMDELDFFRRARRFVRRASRRVRRRVRRTYRRVRRRVRRTYRRVRRHVRRASRHVRRHVRRAYRHVRRAARHVSRGIRKGLRFLNDKLKVLKIAQALKSLISKGLDFFGFNFVKDARELRSMLVERSVNRLRSRLVRFIANNFCKKILEKIPKVGQALMVLRAKRSLARKVNTVFKRICGALGHNKSIEDHFQRMGQKIISQKTLRYLPYHNRRIPIVGTTLAGEIEHLRTRIITAILSRYGLCDGKRRSRRRRSRRRRSRRRRYRSRRRRRYRSRRRRYRRRRRSRRRYRRRRRSRRRYRSRRRRYRRRRRSRRRRRYRSRRRRYRRRRRSRRR